MDIKRSQNIKIKKYSDSNSSSASDQVAIEEPMEIQICSNTESLSAAKSISITMRTPGHDKDLALGFLFSESIIKNNNDVITIDQTGNTDQDDEIKNIIRVTLNSQTNLDMKKLERHFYTTSSCGVCGKTSIEAIYNQGCKICKSRFSIKHTKLTELPNKLRAQQVIFGETGGLHAAAAFNAHGEVILVREDVGRHNAVDKIIGALLRRKQLPADDLGIIVSGRTSFELMQKIIVAGVPMLAAVSAPSSLAISLAKEFEVTLVGFLRGKKFNTYSSDHRITC
jgi:FdhD protein